MTEQTGFVFDAPLLHYPVSQLPPPAKGKRSTTKGIFGQSDFVPLEETHA